MTIKWNPASLRVDMGHVAPGQPPIDGQPWSFGEPVQGYAWHAPAERAVMLLQHGFGVHTGLFVTQFNAIIPNLLKRGISVYGFDMRGHGRSGGRRAATDVRQAVRHHIAATGTLAAKGLPVFVYGHSLGGWVTASSVARSPAGITGAIISSPVMVKPVNWPMTALIKALALIAPGRRAPIPAADSALHSRLSDQVEMTRSDPLVYKGGATTNLVAASALSLASENWTLFDRWRVPTLIQHGTDDSATDVEGSRAFHDVIASEDKTLHIVEGGRHDLLNDLDRDAVLIRMLNWVDKRLDR